MPIVKGGKQRHSTLNITYDLVTTTFFLSAQAFLQRHYLALSFLAQWF